MRLLSYNIRSMRDDAGALRRVIGALRPDIACLQEVPRFWGWRRKRDWLARGVGLGVASSRRACGLAVLATPRTHLLHREYHLLSPNPGPHRRGLAVAVLEVPSEGRLRRLVAASAHLDLDADWRLTHLREILDLLAAVRRRHRAPVVLAGDINERPGSPSWDLLASHFVDAGVARASDTYSSRSPRKRIDGIFVDPVVEIVRCGVPDGEDLFADYPRATDHLPVLAELRLG
jgi:endonuclease/exonuclease/phosphatase family metal-dependent hydrolase